MPDVTPDTPPAQLTWTTQAPPTGQPDRSEWQRQLGRRIASARALCGVTQGELAQRVGCTVQTVSGYERSCAMPSAWTLVLVARVLDVEIGWLAGGGGALP